MRSQQTLTGRNFRQDMHMLTIKVIAPGAVSSRVRSVLETAPDIGSLRILIGASAYPQGDVFEVDIHANPRTR